ncbi:MAG TPA: hypothetical protein VH722_03210 [Alphaproteobacteria bacterium]|nr:hypothetical protein [Alphaproteobacteria bacterium]
MIRKLLLAATLAAVAGQGAQAAWRGHGQNSQHSGIAPVPAQKLNRIAWKTPIDLDPQVTGDVLFAHYGSAIVTEGNTVILPVKTGAEGGFRVEAHSGATGATVWSLDTDYVLPDHDWTPVFGPVLTLQNRVYYPGGAGLIRWRDTPNKAAGDSGWFAFYGAAAYQANQAAYQASVKISTPLTADDAGNVYFGFVAEAGAPAGLKSGIAKVAADGTATWIAAAEASGDKAMTQVQMNCAPAISYDKSTLYIAVSNGSGSGYAGYLLGLDTKTLQPKYKVRLKDPSVGDDAEISDDSSASPTVGPNGDVYFGVLARDYPYHHARGWLLHFDGTLKQTKIPGSFGWDITPSIVPAALVPSYKGKSSYLLMTKYNNYAGVGITLGDGRNKVAVLDPNASQIDEYSTTSTPVMKEVLTMMGPTQFPGGTTGQVYEWCISTAVVDPTSSSIFVNSEDGHLYRWNLKTNTIAESIQLNTPLPQAYTATIVGQDGTVYTTNNSMFYAVRK